MGPIILVAVIGGVATWAGRALRPRLPVALVQEIWRRASDTDAMTSAHVTELIAFTIDCSDATRLARLYTLG